MQSLTEKMAVVREASRFAITSPEKAAEALLFIRELEAVTAALKKRVKERAVALMDKEGIERVDYSLTDPETGEVRQWQVVRSYAKTTKEYQPGNVFAALGKLAFPFLSVKKTSLEKYLSEQVSKGWLSDETLALATKDPIEKTIAGSGVILRPVKE